jgi:formiminoglutamase
MHMNTSPDWPWQGRMDPEEGPKALRWHQIVRPRTPDARSGLALIGFSCDAGVARNQGRVGAAAGPAAARTALANLAWHGQHAVYEWGDVHCAGDGLENAQAELAARVAEALNAGLLPVVIGGGHEVAWGSWQGLARHLGCGEPSAPDPAIAIVNLDAHFDLRAGRASSGTPFRQIAEANAERGWNFRYGCLGVARVANTAALFERAQALGVWYREDDSLQALSEIESLRAQWQAFIAGCEHLHLSICMDVFPASAAPGVSAPAALGIPVAFALEMLRWAKASGKLRLLEFAELNPSFDQDQRTAKLLARLLSTVA